MKITNTHTNKMAGEQQRMKLVAELSNEATTTNIIFLDKEGKKREKLQKKKS